MAYLKNVANEKPAGAAGVMKKRHARNRSLVHERPFGRYPPLRCWLLTPCNSETDRISARVRDCPGHRRRGDPVAVLRRGHGGHEGLRLTPGTQHRFDCCAASSFLTESQVWVCAVIRRRFPVGENPTRQTLQPE